MCKDVLKMQRIRLIASDTGGTYGRTIELNTENGQLLIKTIGMEVSISEIHISYRICPG